MSKDDSTWLNVSYIGFALLMMYVGYQLVYSIGIEFGWVERYDEIFPMVNNIAAAFIGSGATYWLGWFSTDRRDYHLSTIGEVKKVSWPAVDDTKKMTIVVVVVVAVFSVILSLFDMVWSRLLQAILPS